MSDQEVVLPGKRLGRSSDLHAGPGTFERNGFIFASLSGFLKLTTIPGQEVSTVSVERDYDVSVVPRVGSTVIGRVTRITTQQANVQILCCDEVVLSGSFSGIIKSEDIRATDVDRAQVYQSFRPEDIVKARVVSMGDSRSYQLSTASNELGVIFAKSVAGATMIPVSWESMQCPKTKTKEFRKVAKIE
eukprot:TRINITY_DN13829_c0_g1_i1.p1 TRINITY_DN13829_c0_g1~~TRINITY_DN13829_c0_g1_i1.p1  ORF type:complete len:189 (+),score=60.13 TRINITY_DN13829_c0_g1_i1:3-569(+)